jgi:hypothetical protein
VAFVDYQANLAHILALELRIKLAKGTEVLQQELWFKGFEQSGLVCVRVIGPLAMPG